MGPASTAGLATSVRGRRRGETADLRLPTVRVDPDVPDNDIRQLAIALEYYAETKGYCFATIFYEDTLNGGSDRSAFAELIEELQRSEARHVIAPSTDHFSAYPLLRTTMLLQLAEKANAQLHTLSDRYSNGPT